MSSNPLGKLIVPGIVLVAGAAIIFAISFFGGDGTGPTTTESTNPHYLDIKAQIEAFSKEPYDKSAYYVLIETIKGSKKEGLIDVADTTESTNLTKLATGKYLLVLDQAVKGFCEGNGLATLGEFDEELDYFESTDKSKISGAKDLLGTYKSALSLPKKITAYADKDQYDEGKTENFRSKIESYRKAKHIRKNSSVQNKLDEAEKSLDRQKGLNALFESGETDCDFFSQNEYYKNACESR